MPTVVRARRRAGVARRAAGRRDRDRTHRPRSRPRARARAAHRAGEKVGRNDPCPCGSGKKYKRCCYLKQDALSPAPTLARSQRSRSGAVGIEPPRLVVFSLGFSSGRHGRKPPCVSSPSRCTASSPSARSTVVKVLPGITGIVGPNGCGKSNISEAVRWALGEQSAKSLRGAAHGRPDLPRLGSRKPVGLAEVELTFSNDGTLAVPWSEIAVSRRLYRTGESEYLLNSGVTRLRDILDLFAGTGANPRAYSVMDQDKLNHVLTAKPHERRVFIEEAAGIARYKQQRNETQGKLEATRQNLVRVRDVMDEVKRQLGSLERQARKAQQYKALQNEKRELRARARRRGLGRADVRGGAARARARRRLRDGEQALRTRIAGARARARRRSARRSRRATTASAICARPCRRCRASSSACWSGASRWASSSARLDEEAVRLDEDLRIAGERLEHARRRARAAARPRSRDAQSRGRRARRAAAQALEARARATRARASPRERDRLEALRLEQVRLAAERTDLMREAGELRERQASSRAAPSGWRRSWRRPRRRPSALTSHRASLETSRERVVAELDARWPPSASASTALLAERETRARRPRRHAWPRRALELAVAAVELRGAARARARARGLRRRRARRVRGRRRPSGSGRGRHRGRSARRPAGPRACGGSGRSASACSGSSSSASSTRARRSSTCADQGAGAATFLPLEHLNAADERGHRARQRRRRLGRRRSVGGASSPAARTICSAACGSSRPRRGGGALAAQRRRRHLRHAGRARCSRRPAGFVAARRTRRPPSRAFAPRPQARAPRARGRGRRV